MLNTIPSSIFSKTENTFGFFLSKQGHCLESKVLIIIVRHKREARTIFFFFLNEDQID